MSKPIKHSKEAYTWSEVEEYINVLHGCEIRNFANKTYGGDHDDRDYLDYWHWLIDTAYIIGNGCYFTIEGDLHAEAEPWQQEITEWLLDEFGEPDDFTGRSAVFWVEW